MSLKMFEKRRAEYSEKTHNIDIDYALKLLRVTGEVLAFDIDKKKNLLIVKVRE